MRSWRLVLALLLIAAEARAGVCRIPTGDPGATTSAADDQEPVASGRDGQATPAMQATPATPATQATQATPLSREWMVGAGVGSSVNLLQSRGDSRYVAPSISWGHELTRGGGPGMLRGRFAWAIEVVPLFAQFEPAIVRGVSVSPLVWRWNFESARRAQPYAELAVGGLWTNGAVPQGTVNTNFVAHAGVGVRMRVSPSRALVAAYRFQHISNGNQLPRNPGVNAHMLWLGVSVR